MKKNKMIIGIIFTTILVGILLSLLIWKKVMDSSYTSLMEMEEYKEITTNNIKSINIIKNTEEEEMESILADTKKEIEKTYQELASYKVGKETNKVCYAKRTTYTFLLEDDREASIEIECDWLVLNGKRYLLKR